MSSRKSCFLQEEHAWMAELEHELEFARRESQDWAAEVNEAWAAELLAAERATTTEWGLKMGKVH